MRGKDGIQPMAWGGVACVAALLFLSAGCTTYTYKDVDVAKILRELDSDRVVNESNNGGPDTQEAAIAALLPSSAGKVNVTVKSSAVPSSPVVSAAVRGSSLPSSSVDNVSVAARNADLPLSPVGNVSVTVKAGVAQAGATRNDEITIQPDCLIQVRVKEDKQLEGSYAVNEIGAIDLGYVGPVILYNMTEKQAAQKIRDVLESRYFKTATVTLKILKASYDKMMVLGAVNKPGMIKIGAGDAISLNDALLRAGGLRPAIKGAKVRIVKGGLTKAVAFEGVEYILVSEDGKPSIPDVRLRNNDVVYVFSSDSGTPAEVGEKEVYVLGEVAKPGVYRFSTAEPCSMMHLLFKLGNLPAWANAKGIKIMRRDKDGTEAEIPVNAEKILKEGSPEDDVVLENGDRVVIPPRRISLF